MHQVLVQAECDLLTGQIHLDHGSMPGEVDVTVAADGPVDLHCGRGRQRPAAHFQTPAWSSWSATSDVAGRAGRSGAAETAFGQDSSPSTRANGLAAGVRPNSWTS